jgi:hypothetical protein
MKYLLLLLTGCQFQARIHTDTVVVAGCICRGIDADFQAKTLFPEKCGIAMDVPQDLD